MGLKERIDRKLDELDEKFPDNEELAGFALLFGILALVGCVITLIVGVVTLLMLERVDANLTDLEYMSAGRGGICYATFDYTFQEKEYTKTISTNWYLLYHEGPTHVYIDPYDGGDPTTLIEQMAIPGGCFLGGAVLILSYVYDNHRRKKKQLRMLQEDDISWD